LNDHEVEEISNSELKRTMIRMINEIEVDIYKYKENTNKQVNELKENSNKLLWQIWKKIQDTKEEFNKNIEIMKNINTGNENFNTSKNPVEILVNRIEQGESRISGLADKVEKLEHSDKDKENILRKYE
jgi:hypothetical protein